ncbi:hypothetical protein HPG69_010319 [Diceros bicornis minor]|uniref:Hexosyltransferase n=1 Tax=Diceros bicornis minor TaxID=77932 RepID=A0A7J7F7B8_DICBM|nr:hypothetical protein HPG69_010319 [Diceros bicornis minor]
MQIKGLQGMADATEVTKFDTYTVAALCSDKHGQENNAIKVQINLKSGAKQNGDAVMELEKAREKRVVFHWNGIFQSIMIFCLMRHLGIKNKLRKLKVFHSQEINQEEEPEARVLLNRCGWPWLQDQPSEQDVTEIPQMEPPAAVAPESPGDVVPQPAPGQHVKARSAIRVTWGEKKSWWGYEVLTFFLLGRQGEGEDQVLALSLEDEHLLYGDIIQQDFLDTHNNLTLKTMMTFKKKRAQRSSLRYEFDENWLQDDVIDWSTSGLNMNSPPFKHFSSLCLNSLHFQVLANNMKINSTLMLPRSSAVSLCVHVIFLRNVRVAVTTTPWSSVCATQGLRGYGGAPAGWRGPPRGSRPLFCRRPASTRALRDRRECRSLSGLQLLPTLGLGREGRGRLCWTRKSINDYDMREARRVQLNATWGQKQALQLPYKQVWDEHLVNVVILREDRRQKSGFTFSCYQEQSQI